MEGRERGREKARGGEGRIGEGCGGEGGGRGEWGITCFV